MSDLLFIKVGDEYLFWVLVKEKSSSDLGSGSNQETVAETFVK